MKLFYLGNEVDTTKEQRFLSKNADGFKVTIKYKLGTYIEGEHVETFYKCTDVHYQYKSATKKNKIAFESDIINTGFNDYVDNIESVLID